MSWATSYQTDNSKQYGWQNCYSASNSIDFNFPPLMSDGRNWAQWQPDALVNERIQMKKVFRQIGDIVSFSKIMECKL